MFDHRRLGRELDLFGSDPLIGAGLPYWLPAGAAVRHALEEYVHAVERRAGYQHVHSPVLAKRELYELSGHWAHYRDDMFPPMDAGGEELVLRPSLCPHHALIYRSRGRSYRELPLRLAELGGMYRSEASGVLGGLTRVRSIQLNDAHVFCSADDAAAEAAAALALIGDAHAAMGIAPARLRLSLPGPGGKYAGAPSAWERSTALLVEALSESRLEYEAEEGEAAFYGPKIDVQIVDAAGRESTLSTVQIDFHQPERFGLEYVGADGERHRPVMVHRSIIGSLERAVAQLIEVHGGAFPPWLAPVQVVLVPIGPEQHETARAVAGRCLDAGLRVEVAGADHGSVGARVHAARLAPYVGVVGAREAGADELALRLRDGRRLDALPVAEAVARIAARVTAHAVDLW
ncbi:threonine--tRNA ligase [Jiangella rhizosphaerae]|uniref:Threonine--tRNA ligase n=1 Tax=Jiangella rhizosphaerae TaxID=2293569 RepID=A0A418KUR2_9ACTN|nr:threonine--tRNA ligase [Jiangella rhizosphaerae]